MKGREQVKSKKKRQHRRPQASLRPSGDGLKVVHLPVSVLIPYLDNPRDNEKSVDAVADSILAFGFNNPIALRNDNTIIAGHSRLKAALKLGLRKVPCIRLNHLTEAQAIAYTIADNRTAEMSDWIMPTLGRILSDLKAEDALQGIGWDERAINRIINEGLKSEAREDDDDVPAVPKVAITQPGDIITLGKHRLMCGDSTKQRDVERLMNGAIATLCLTDPPYCSGGFQEAGKSAGSVGTDAEHRSIVNDRLSTRGFGALLKMAFGNLNASYLYSFTDWRMWVYLFDLAESSGYGVRSMIVWDKGYPGMGRGWRAQHELILWGCKQTPPYPKHFSATGNVISFSRTGNKHHTTEKPVELIVALLENTPFAKTIADPFLGSGTTIIGCEQLGRICYGMEIDPIYCDITVQRWENYTGLKAVRPRRKEAVKCA